MTGRTHADPVAAFRAAMFNAGVPPPDEIVGDGAIHRFRVNGERAGKRSGAYRLFTDGTPAGWFVSHKAGALHKWSSGADSAQRMPRNEWIAYRAELAHRQQQRAADDARRHAAAAQRAQTLLDAATGDVSTHPYAAKKAVPFGAGVRRGGFPQCGWDDAILVPLYGADGALDSLQAIAADGTKRFLAGGRVAGAFYPFGELRGAPRVLIAEGLATLAAAVHATGWPGAAAMSANNLTAVARTARELAAPGAQIVVLADDDRDTAGNPGLRCATEAARAVGARLAVPDLGRKADMWDVLHDRDAHALRELIEKATAPRNDEETPPMDDRATDTGAPPPHYSETGTGQRVRHTNDEGKPRAQADVLIDLGKQHRLIHDAGGDAFAVVETGRRRSVLRVDGSEYREALGREYYLLARKGANGRALGDAVATLTAFAKHEGPCEPVYLRTAATPDGAIAIDLGGDCDDAAIVTPHGWRIGPAPVHFRRAGRATALPRPAADATPHDFARLWHYVNVAPHDRVLLAAWSLAALRPRGPYPILVFAGEQGSGKSSATRAVKGVTDPSAAPLRPPPRDLRDLLVGAAGTHVLALDNLSGADAELSDALCRLSTGGALAERRLYSNTDEVLVELQRPVILNGIDDPATRPDLADRCLHLLLPPLENHTTEADLAARYAADRPRILGALLNALVLALRDPAAVQLHARLRMADFAKWSAAGLPALGFSADEFVAAYTRNRAELHDIAIDASPVASALVRFMAGRDSWTGGTAELLGLLAPDAPGPAWPRSAKGLLGALRRLAPALRAAGVGVHDGRTEFARLLTVTKTSVHKGRKQASEASEASATEGNHAEANASASVSREPAKCQPRPQASASVSRNPLISNGNDTSDASDASKPTLCTPPPAAPGDDLERPLGDAPADDADDMGFATPPADSGAAGKEREI